MRLRVSSRLLFDDDFPGFRLIFDVDSFRDSYCGDFEESRMPAPSRRRLYAPDDAASMAFSMRAPD